MKSFLLITAVLALASCGSGTDGPVNPLTNTPTKYIPGEKVYMGSCVACHQQSGEGVEGAFPPLASSDYLLADKTRAIEIAANGMEGEIIVNGKVYNQNMAPQGLSKQEVMDVVNYVLNAWDNNGGEVTLKEVEAVMN